MANLLLLADIASKTCSNQNDVGVQTDDNAAITTMSYSSNDGESLNRNLASSTSFVLGFEPAPFGHDYIKQNDFDILVNANHDYYNRIPQTDEDLEHSYAFSVAQSLTDADCSAPMNVDSNVDDVFFEGIANLEEHMGIHATTSRFAADSSVFEEIVQEDLDSSSMNVVRLGGVELEATLFSDVVEIIEQNKLHFDDILRYVDVESEQTLMVDENHLELETTKAGAVVGAEHTIADVNSQTVMEYVCCWNECVEKFLDLNKLTTHLRNDHVIAVDKREPIICKWRTCTKSTGFSKRYLLERHLRIHTNEKPFKCHVCQANFASCEHLRRHVRKHEGDRPFSCKTCAKSFSSSGDYCRHIKTHEKKSKYACVRCKKHYKDDSGLRKHKKLCDQNEIVASNIHSVQTGIKYFKTPKSDQNVPCWLRNVIKKSSKIVVVNIGTV